MLSNTFEYSLQRVNPKLTLPYWDFTIESSSAGGAGDGVSEPQASSPLLQSSWFGTHDPTDNQVILVALACGLFGGETQQGRL